MVPISSSRYKLSSFAFVIWFSFNLTGHGWRTRTPVSGGVGVQRSSRARDVVELSRRETLQKLGITSLPLLVATIFSRQRVRADDLRETIAKTASRLPGYGPADSYYPFYFEGEWWLTRECVGVITPQGEAVAEPADLKDSQERLGEKITYPVRFLRYGDEGAIVADRGFNEASMWRARYQGPSDLYREAITSQWTPSNPNVLTVSFPSGMTREVKVTRRSFEQGPNEEAFGISEYCRVAQAQQDTGLGSVPAISAIRVLTRYKRVEPSVIQGLELVKFYPAVSLAPEPQPTLVLKSRLRLERRQEGSIIP